MNAIGYCIGGTTLAMTLALMKHRKDKSVNTATFFTALTDFADQGDFTPFLQNDFIDGIEAEVNSYGILRSHIMSRTFSFLRSNDLIYRPAIRSYMMGETPPAFDLLYWNGDGTNLPGKMAVQYLRQLCQRNEFVTEGIELCGERLHVSDVTVPVYAITCETDHIAAWKTSYRGVQQMGEGKDLHRVAVRPYRRHREPAFEKEVRPLHQRGSEPGRSHLVRHRPVPRRQLVAPLGRMDHRQLGQGSCGPRTG